jgi:predicted nucleic-acid-binding Zn-ribbon protein
MKKSLVCPKCEGRRVVHCERAVLPLRDPNRLSTEPVTLAVTVDEKWYGGFTPIGQFEQFICARCGYTEWYALGIDALTADEQRGIRILDNEPKAGLR